MLNRSVTQQYPEVRPELPPRSRGVIALVEENCTVCMLCARECPDWCIYIDSHKETLPAPEGGRPRARNMLDRFAIDFSLCMYCGICIEVCPFDALFWSPEFEYADGDIRNLLHEKDRLAGWAQTVPPPPAHEPNADPPKELAATSRPARPRPTPPSGASAPGAPGTSAPGASASGSAAGSKVPGPGASGPAVSGSGVSGSAVSGSAVPDPTTSGPTTSGSGTSGPVPGSPASGVPGSPGPAAPGSPASDTPGPQDSSAPRTPGPQGSSETGAPAPPPGESPRAPGRPSRPATSASHARVRAIRPPGSLPKPTGSSTGGSSVEKLSTGKGGVPPAADAPEQTSPADPGEEPEKER
ncbi:4Fe-4S binding protein [Streptosporangium sp. DT93]|uniref:NuoI/complex I 23 kDa subunit family protein n=1 Tax=Streptosporangium sp. DT93 TaxID=3393428 RepID=UPI003CE8F51C